MITFLLFLPAELHKAHIIEKIVRWAMRFQQETGSEAKDMCADLFYSEIDSEFWGCLSGRGNAGAGGTLACCFLRGTSLRYCWLPGCCKRPHHWMASITAWVMVPLSSVSPPCLWLTGQDNWEPRPGASQLLTFYARQASNRQHPLLRQLRPWGVIK